MSAIALPQLGKREPKDVRDGNGSTGRRRRPTVEYLADHLPDTHHHHLPHPTRRRP